MTQIAEAQKGNITAEMEAVALKENIDVKKLRELVAAGQVAILKNKGRSNVIPTAVGKGLSIKVNANIGTSNQRSSIEQEIEKVKIIEETGADTLMDLSTGNLVDDTRRAILAETVLPVGTVPIYQAGKEAIDKYHSILELDKDKLFSDIEKQCKDGVDFITVHCGITKFVVDKLIEQGRVMGVVSRGGAMLAAWVKEKKQENPLYEYYDELLDIARTYDVTLSLGDGMRPGCGADAGDRAQVSETLVLGELVNRARKAGVQTMVEGPGHVPLNLVPGMIETIKTLTQGAPLYVLGPLVTDVAPGYDHITAAIGGTVAAMNGADFLCYVTPSEHIALPEIQHVKDGIIASKIAAHAAEVALGRKQAVEQDLAMGIARKKLDWDEQAKYAIDTNVFEKIEKGEPCTMCGEYCSVKLINKHF